jgi:hypothetical protein
LTLYMIRVMLDTVLNMITIMFKDF